MLACLASLLQIAGCGTVTVPEEEVGQVVNGVTVTSPVRPPPQIVPLAGCADDDCVCNVPPDDFDHAESFRLLNEYRVANGLEPLVYSRRLQVAADAHAENLYRLGFFDHESPDGKGPADRAWDIGFCHNLVGENIASGLNSRETPLEVFNRFKQSPGHDENMLYPPYHFVGIGHFYIETEQGSEHRWVQMMALE